MYEILRFAQNDKDLVCHREGGGGWWLSHQPPPPSKTQVAVILSEFASWRSSEEQSPPLGGRAHRR